MKKDMLVFVIMLSALAVGSGHIKVTIPRFQKTNDHQDDVYLKREREISNIERESFHAGWECGWNSGYDAGMCDRGFKQAN